MLICSIFLLFYLEIKTESVPMTKPLYFVCLLYYFVIIFWKFVEAVYEMEQNVSGQGVRVGLRATLGIDDAGDVGALGKKVVSVNDAQQPSFEERTGQTGVPYPFRSVHTGVVVAGSGKGREVGGEFHLPGKF